MNPACVMNPAVQMSVSTTQAQTNNFDFTKLINFCVENQIDPFTMENLKQLTNWEIIVVADDSGSMSTPLSDNPRMTRWEELKNTMSKLIELATCLDANGVDLYFLNRGVLKNVMDVRQVTHAFNKGPSGTTPTRDVFDRIMREKYNGEKNLLLLIATDGAPNNMNEEQFFNYIKARGGFGPEEVLQSKVRISFLICSDNKKDVKFLNQMDKIPGVDVTDDYDSEKKQTKNPYFNRVSYIAKALLGPVDARYDAVDRK